MVLIYEMFFTSSKRVDSFFMKGDGCDYGDSFDIKESVYKMGMNREQKEAVALLSIGTFLEYFDLMLYIHMSVLLNDLFFPQSNPTIAKMMAAFAFCSTYILRPVGGFVVGKIGDTFGRKYTITLTTFIMAISCIIIALIPTYKEIGILATITVLCCRMLQGFSSLGEITGAQVYVTESLKNPHKAVSSGIIVCVAGLGGTFALIVSSFAMHGANWRVAFWIGAVIAVIGTVARAKLRETPEFTDYKRRIAIKGDLKREKPSKKLMLAYAFTELQNPICFYVTYIFCAEIMKNKFGLTPEQIIHQNLKVDVVLVICVFTVAMLVKKIHPIKIALISFAAFVFFLPFIPYWMGVVSSLFFLGCIQVWSKSFSFSTCGTLDAIQFKYFPTSSRFTSVGTICGVSFALSTVIVSFGLIPLTEYFGYYGIWFLFIPTAIGYCWSLFYFRNLEKKSKCYDEYPYECFLQEDTASKEEDFNYDLSDDYLEFENDCEYSVSLLKKITELNKGQMYKVNVKLINKAMVFCKKWHHGQMRKSGDMPYYSHPFAVAEIIADYYLKTDVMVAAILHDILEDTECSVELLKKEFNFRITQIVERLTSRHFKDRNKEGAKLSLEKLIAKLKDLNDNEALFVKSIDRLHNLSTADALKESKREKMAKESELLRDEIAVAADRLNIPNKLLLEQEMFRYCEKIFNVKCLTSYGRKEL